MGIPERIREVAERHGMSLEDFAEIIDVKPQRLKDVLRGKQRITEDILVGMIQRLAVDVNWLLTGLETHGDSLSPEESRLIDVYRACDYEGREAFRAIGAALSARMPTSTGSIKQRAGRDIITNSRVEKKS